MSTAKHSPAPWTYNEDRVAIEAAPDENGEQVTVLYVRGALDNPKDDLPLILEAPALLAALRAIVHELDEYGFINSQDNDPDGEESHAVGTARAAIARAEGRA